MQHTIITKKLSLVCSLQYLQEGKRCLINKLRFPANICLDEDVFKTSSRRLDQDKYVRLSLTSSEDVFKTSWSRPIYSSWPYVFKTSSRCLQDVFKTSSRRLQGVFKTSSRRLQGIFKTSCKDIFKTFPRRTIRLNCLPRSHL